MRRVDGIDDPSAVTRVVRGPVLLAEDGVARVGTLDSLAEKCLDLGIGLGDEGLVVLRGDRQLAGKAGERDSIRLVEPFRSGTQQP